jgi:hypothetical protein
MDYGLEPYGQGRVHISSNGSAPYGQGRVHILSNGLARPKFVHR